MGSSGEAGLGREDVFHPFDKLQILQEAFGDLKAGSVPARREAPAGGKKRDSSRYVQRSRICR